MIKRFVAILLMSTALILTSCEASSPTSQESQSSAEPSVITTTGSISATQPESSPIISSHATTTPATAPPEPSIDMAYVSSLTFDEAYMFNPYGYAVVGRMTDGEMKYGIIGEDGLFVIDPEYDAYRTARSDVPFYAPEIDIGFTWLQKDGLWGFVNEKCEWVVAPTYADCTCFTIFGLAGVMVDGKWGFVGTTGEMVVAPTYDAVLIDERTKYAQVKKDDLWGLIDMTGEEILAPVSSGRILTEGSYGENGYWDGGGENLALILSKNCLMKLGGGIIMDDVSIDPGSIGSNHLFYANSVSKGNGYFNLRGELVIPLDDGEIGLPFHDDGVAIVVRHGEGYSYVYHYIDENGNLLTDKEFSEASCFSSNGLACVKFDGKYGYINRSGGFSIEPQFEEAYMFNNYGLACVKLDGKYGYIDESGELVIAPQYDEADTYIHDKYMEVKQDGKAAISDREGKLLTSFDYESIWSRPLSYDIQNSPIFEATQDGKTGIIDAHGNWILPPQYDVIIIFNNICNEGYMALCYSETSYAMIKKGNQFGIISLEGEILVENASESDKISIAPNGYVAVFSDGTYHYVDLDS